MDIGYRVEGYRVIGSNQIESLGAAGATTFTDSYQHMECLGGMRLQVFKTLFTCATPGTPASLY